MSEIYKVFDDSGLTALTDHMKATRTKANSNEEAIVGLGEDMATLSEEVVTALSGKAPTDHTHSEYLTSYTETDPTVPAWAKAESKPTYTYDEVGAAAASHEHLFDRGVTTEGDGAAYTATIDGITALEAGLSFIMIPHTTSTSQTATLNVNGLGAKALRRPISSNNASTVAPSTTNWLYTSKPVRVMYNGTYWIVMDMPRPNAPDLYGTVAIESGGTGATTAEAAREALGITELLANAGGVKIQTGSYIGTGTYGSSGKCTLTFEFEPRLLIIQGSNAGTYWMLPYQWGAANMKSMNIGTGDAKGRSLPVTIDGNTISWYDSGYANYQHNSEGSTYYYIAIG